MTPAVSSVSSQPPASTVYTAEYRPAEGAVRYHWPDRTWTPSTQAASTSGSGLRNPATRLRLSGL
jgi:hypothetical protein